MEQISLESMTAWARMHGRHRMGEHPDTTSYAFKLHDDLRQPLDDFCRWHRIGKSHLLNYLIQQAVAGIEDELPAT